MIQDKEYFRNVMRFVDSDDFQKWVERHATAELRFYGRRTRVETLENVLARTQFTQEMYARMSQRVLERRFELMERAGTLDEMEESHNGALKKFEDIRSKSTRLWEKISTEQVKNNPSQKKVDELTGRYNEIEKQKKAAEEELQVIWSLQGVVRLQKEILYWKSQRVQHASLRVSKKSASYSGRLLRLREQIESERKHLETAQQELETARQEVPKQVACQLLEHFVCFPAGRWGLLYSLIEDQKLFPIPIARNKMYVVNLEEGFSSVREWRPESAAA